MLLPSDMKRSLQSPVELRGAFDVIVPLTAGSGGAAAPVTLPHEGDPPVRQVAPGSDCCLTHCRIAELILKIHFVHCIAMWLTGREVESLCKCKCESIPCKAASTKSRDGQTLKLNSKYPYMVWSSSEAVLISLGSAV